MKSFAALVIGLVLAALPFLLYGSRGHVHVPHSDHAPRHGGELFMLGDHHLELVASHDRVELYLSDGSRRPQRPTSGSVALSGGGELPLRWQHQHLIAELPAGTRAERLEVETDDGERLALALP